MSYVREIDMGWQRIKLNVRQIDDSYVKVGVQDGSEIAKEDAHPSGEKWYPESELEQIATANEFGTRTIPERSFIRATFDSKQREIRSLQNRLYGSLLDRKITVEKGLKILGVFMVSKIQERITNLRFPANAPSTIERKGSSNPLIDSGQLRASIISKEFVNAG